MMLEVADTEAILKAARLGHQEAEGEHPERWARRIEEQFFADSYTLRNFLVDDLTRLVLANPYKATTAIPLSPDQIRDIKALVRQHYLAHVAPDARVAFWNVDTVTKLRWQNWGIIGPERFQDSVMADAIDEMVVAARVAELLEHTTSYRRMRQLAAERPQTRNLEIARLVARQHAGFAIERLADRHGDRLRSLAFDDDQRTLLGSLIERHLAGKLGAGTGSLEAALRREVGGDTFERDWRRVAVTETRYAYNYGSLVHYMEQGWKRVYYQVQPTACDYCKRLLLNRDGTPKVFTLEEIIDNLAEDGGMNVGRSASKIGGKGGWRVGALIHPWCRCRPVPYLGPDLMASRPAASAAGRA